jgi:hypothetical protein
MEVEPDFDCYMPTATDGGMDRDAGLDGGAVVTRNISFRTVLKSFVAGVAVDVFSGFSTLGTPTSTQILDADGGGAEFSLPAATTLLSVRVHPLTRDNASASIVESREYGLRLSGQSSSLEGFALISDSRELTVRLALGGSGQDDPSKALLMADVRDCAGRPVNGAQVELIDGQTKQPVAAGTETDGPHVAYTYFALPTPTCTFTTDQQEFSDWLMIDAPVNVVNGSNTHSYRLRVKGRRQATDVAPVVIVEREVELFPGVISFVRP